MSIRHAATLCLVRSADAGLEVLLGKRGSSARFVAGAHVFPGGGLDPVDGAPAAITIGGGHRDPWKMAAIRETFEEVGILVGADVPVTLSREGDRFYDDLTEAGVELNLAALHYLSTWVTPPGLPWRYDTRFYLAVADSEPSVDGHEFVEATWTTPSQALARMRKGAWQLVSPTIAHLDFLDQFGDIDALLDAIADRRDLTRIDQFLVEGVSPVGLEVEP